MCPDDRWLTFLLPVDKFSSQYKLCLGFGIKFSFFSMVHPAPQFQYSKKKKKKKIADNVKCVADEKIL